MILVTQCNILKYCKCFIFNLYLAEIDFITGNWRISFQAKDRFFDLLVMSVMDFSRKFVLTLLLLIHFSEFWKIVNHHQLQNNYADSNLIFFWSALTERIVAVLPKMKCPHRIEPHQIQGLDFIHIYPVVQVWKSFVIINLGIKSSEN